MIPAFNDLKRKLKSDISSLPVLKVALLGDTATQFLATAIRGMGIERGFNINLYESDFNQIELQFSNPDSELFEFQADYIVVFQSTHKLLQKYNRLTDSQKISLADERLEFVQTICNKSSSTVIYFNYSEIDDNVYGNFANKVEKSFIYQIRKINFELMNMAIQNHQLFICDIAAIQNKFGRDMMFDTSVYINTDMVLSIDAVPYVAARVIDVICAAQGKLKKCIILDLDNTLWGGIIGDDGIENIQLNHALGVGKAFSEFQQWIKKLKDRGIIIAICSKNNEPTAKEPFEKHPEMILQLDDIAVFVANWDTKVENIQQIQSILNIGFDSMVFIDDNPFERNIVKENIPQITVPDMPEDPGDFLEYLYGLNLFETVSISDNDAERTKQYQIETKRLSSKKDFFNESEFLESLNMFSEISEFNKFNIPRLAQLSQRSNQFNLRTIRFSEAEIEKIANDNHFKCFSFTLSDKFGDNGIVSFVILEIQDQKTLFVNTWLMSCRVLKRNMENFILNTIVQFARDNQYEKIIGEYIPTSKNEIVRNHYSDMNFKPIIRNNRNLYVLDIDTYTDKKCSIVAKINN